MSKNHQTVIQQEWNNNVISDEITPRRLPPQPKLRTLNGADVKSTIYHTNSAKKGGRSAKNKTLNEQCQAGKYKGVQTSKHKFKSPYSSDPIKPVLGSRAVKTSDLSERSVLPEMKLELERDLCMPQLEIDISGSIPCDIDMQHNLFEDDINNQSMTEIRRLMEGVDICGANLTEEAYPLCRLEMLGRGSSSAVYKSVLVNSLTVCAEKVVIVRDQDKRVLLKRELDSLRQSLKASMKGDEKSKPCPYIVNLINVVPHPQEGTLSICLEYMDGGSLQDIVTNGGCQNERVIRGISRQMVAGLDFLHSLRLIHRDLKPSNTLFSSEGVVKLADFGLAKTLDQGHSMADSFIGTFDYMSPERITGQHYSFKSDVWGLGLTILAVALGSYPYKTEKGFWGLLNAIQEQPAPLPPAETFSDSFQDFIRVACVKNVDDRFTARQLIEHPFLNPDKRSKSPAANESPHTIGKTSIPYNYGTPQIKSRAMDENSSKSMYSSTPLSVMSDSEIYGATPSATSECPDYVSNNNMCLEEQIIVHEGSPRGNCGNDNSTDKVPNYQIEIITKKAAIVPCSQVRRIRAIFMDGSHCDTKEENEDNSEDHFDPVTTPHLTPHLNRSPFQSESQTFPQARKLFEGDSNEVDEERKGDLELKGKNISTTEISVHPEEVSNLEPCTAMHSPEARLPSHLAAAMCFHNDLEESAKWLRNSLTISATNATAIDKEDMRLFSEVYKGLVSNNWSIGKPQLKPAVSNRNDDMPIDNFYPVDEVEDSGQEDGSRVVQDLERIVETWKRYMLHHLCNPLHNDLIKPQRTDDLQADEQLRGWSKGSFTTSSFVSRIRHIGGSANDSPSRYFSSVGEKLRELSITLKCSESILQNAFHDAIDEIQKTLDNGFEKKNHSGRPGLGPVQQTHPDFDVSLNKYQTLVSRYDSKADSSNAESCDDDDDGDSINNDGNNGIENFATSDNIVCCLDPLNSDKIDFVAFERQPSIHNKGLNIQTEKENVLLEDAVEREKIANTLGILDNYESDEYAGEKFDDCDEDE